MHHSFVIQITFHFIIKSTTECVPFFLLSTLFFPFIYWTILNCCARVIGAEYNITSARWSLHFIFKPFNLIFVMRIRVRARTHTHTHIIALIASHRVRALSLIKCVRDKEFSDWYLICLSLKWFIAWKWAMNSKPSNGR